MPYKKKPIQRSWVQKREPFKRMKDNSKFYNSTKWRKTSKQFRNENPTCKHCDNEGKVKPAEVCDHVRGLKYLLENNLNPYDFKELQSLCHHHHNIKSGKEAHGYKEGIPHKNTNKKSD